MGEFLKTVSPQEKGGRKPESLEGKTERLTVPEEREKYAEMRADQAKFEAELQAEAAQKAEQLKAEATGGKEEQYAKYAEMTKDKAEVSGREYMNAVEEVGRLERENDSLRADLEALKQAPKSIWNRLTGGTRAQENAILQQISKNEKLIDQKQRAYIGPVEGMVEAQTESAQVLEMGEEGIVGESMEKQPGSTSGEAGERARARQRERASKAGEGGIKGITR